MVRRLKNGESVRVGKVLSRERGVFSVRWNDDGTEEDLRLDSRNLLAAEGTLRFLSLVAPDEVIRRFTDDALGSVLQLLGEHPKGLKAQDIKSKLLEFGLGKESVDRLWKQIQGRLAKHDDVHVASNVYRVKPSEVLPSVTPPSEAPPSVTAPSVTAPDDGVAGRPEAAPAPEPSKTVVPGAAAGSFPARLAALLGAKHPREIQEYLAEPLRTGLALGRLDFSAIDRFLGELDGADRRILSTLLLAVPRKAPEEPLPPEIHRDVLVAAIAEFRSGASSELRPAAGWLLRRVVASSELPGDVAAPLVQLALFLTDAPQRADLDALDLVALALSRAVPGLGKDVLAPERIALLAQPLPFSEKGGRVPLMVAMHQRWPGSLLGSRWWEGATVEDLVECGQGRFGRIVASREILQAVVRPLMERELAAVTTRARLGFFLRLPAELAEQLPVPAVVDAFQRVSRNDPVAETWTEALSDHERLRAARDELRRAREETGAATALADEAERRAQELSEQCSRLERELHETRNTVLKRRASQDRQLQIDVMRALADLAAEVEELSARGVSSDTMVSRVRGLTATYSLIPIGSVHEKSEFDPKIHKVIAGDPEPGEEVMIHRSGYIWSTPHEEVLLHKALVEHQK